MKNTHANVKDAQELVDNMKANGSFYVKVGDTITNPDGTTRIATAADVANRVMSDAGRAASDRLDQEKVRAYRHLSANDSEVRTYLELLQNNGVNTSEIIGTSGKVELKAMLAQQDERIGAINAEYYAREQGFESEEKDLAQRESVATQEFTEALKAAGLDKTSAEWIANEANNASRAVKGPQPEGFKPTAQVIPTTYSAFNTSYMLGTGGPGPRGPRPGPGPGPGPGTP